MSFGSSLGSEVIAVLEKQKARTNRPDVAGTCGRSFVRVMSPRPSPIELLQIRCSVDT